MYLFGRTDYLFPNVHGNNLLMPTNYSFRKTPSEHTLSPTEIKWTDRHKSITCLRQIDRQTDRHTAQIDRQTDRQADRQAGRLYFLHLHEDYNSDMKL